MSQIRKTDFLLSRKLYKIATDVYQFFRFARISNDKVLVHYSYFLSPDSANLWIQKTENNPDLLDFRHDFVGVPAGGRLHAPGEAKGARLDLAALSDPAARGAALPARGPAAAATRQRQRSIVAPAPQHTRY
jgi:hypothetical protein